MAKHFYMFNILLVSGMFSWLTSCSGLEQKGGGKKKGSTNSDAVDGNGEDAATGTEAGDESAEATGDDNGETSEAKLNQLLTDCGANDIDQSDPNKVLYEKTLKSLPVTKTVLIVNVKVESTLKISVTGKESKQESLVEVKAVTGLTGPLAELAKTEAERQAKESSGLATLTNVPFDQYSSLSDHDIWNGIVCTFVPITELANERGGKKTIVTFDPPLPSSISPKAAASRFAAEIGKKKTFDDITATIKESDNPTLADKKSISGSVTVRKVAAETEVDDGAGGTKKIKADIAFEMTYEFGTAKETFALGIAPVVTYYISYEKKDLVANIVDTTAASGAVAIFIHD